MRIAETFEVRRRFMRSVNLERDFRDERALEGYVLTPHTQDGLERLANGLSPRSGQRAWRITGDFGTGKSSFALALSHLLSVREPDLPTSLTGAVDFRKIGLDEPPRLLPVLVTGSREPIVTALLRSLGSALERTCGRGKRPNVLNRIRQAMDLAPPLSAGDAEALSIVGDAVSHVVGSGKGSGILIVLDELGKFLEFAAMHPDRQDVYFLQRLAEFASRSGVRPVMVLGLLHQGFSEYAGQLTHAAQKEWEKVAGRFEEILFNQPVEQTAGLVADALNVQLGCLPPRLRTLAREGMGRALDLGWYGACAGRRSLTDLAPGIYPLHPSVLPVLVRLFSRFGQNERSLFSFLFSDEPFALREFSERTLDGRAFYRLHDLYDYTRAAFGHRLAVQSYRSHWNQIESVIDSFDRADQDLELRVLKSVGLITMLDHPGLLATEASLAAAVDCQGDARLLKVTIQRLKERAALYNRGSAGGYCLWPHTSVDLEQAYQQASKRVPTHQRVGSLIVKNLEARPLVARRHYIETGNLRHFDVCYSSTDELGPLVAKAVDADGRIVVVLCETEEERQRALSIAASEQLADREELLIAIPSPLQSLARVLQEVQRWEWVSENVPELNTDGYAAEEVSRQLAAARQVLDHRVRSYVGLRQFSESTELKWFQKRKPLAVASSRDLLSKLSRICDRIYDRAPKVLNELVNRHQLSSAASGARMRLIERIIEHPGEPLLGMDEKGKPPEMSMYLSFLKKANLHCRTEEGWAIAMPEAEDDPCRVRPVLERIEEVLEGARDNRVRVSELFAELMRPPFGVREGLLPLLLSTFVVIHEQDVALYEKGAFIHEVKGHVFLRLTKAPETFEIQSCRVTGVRAVVFERLLKLLGSHRRDPKRTDILDVVRPLCIFAAQLPPFTHRTEALTAAARSVRDVLLSAEDPAGLLFEGLPIACSVTPFETGDDASQDRVRRFIERLKGALDELRAAYSALLESMKVDLLSVFERPGGFDAVRDQLAETSEVLLIAITEPRLKAFCIRLSDRRLAEQEWLESIGSLVRAKPPAKWTDADVMRFREELARLAQQFRRVESMAFSPRADGDRIQTAMRVAITNQDGSEVDRVVYLDREEEARVVVMEEQIESLLDRMGRLGVVAAARALSGRLREKAT